ncbi:hypothetical protein ACFXP7_04420 [Microbacterium sp. P06]|uniref:hypothetical protein n=1 Tax=Microbacterium sp. P06 TaxID=3366949 RepID=UPI0037474038
MSATADRTKWGRVKFGAGRLPAMAVSVPLGLVLGAALGAVAVWAGIAGPIPALGGAAFAVCLAVPAVMLIWVLVVDRSTLEGASDQPEESIESRWYLQAAAGAQTDVILVASLGALALTLLPWGGQLDARVVLLGIIGASFVSFSLRYLVLRRKA